MGIIKSIRSKLLTLSLFSLIPLILVTPIQAKNALGGKTLSDIDKNSANKNSANKKSTKNDDHTNDDHTIE